VIGCCTFGGGACPIAFAVALFVARTPRRYGGVVALVVILVIALFALMLITAQTDPSRRDCSDCEYVWGRWWWPPFVVTVLGLNPDGWLVGATAGWLVRRARRAS
jgi:hypothetical protein